MLQLQATVLSKGLASPSSVCGAVTTVVCVGLIPFGLSQISYFTLSLKCFSVPNNASVWGSDPCFSSSHTQQPPARCRSTCSLSSFSHLLPSSYQVLPGSMNSFLATRYSCPLSDGVLQYLLCLKVYS